MSTRLRRGPSSRKTQAGGESEALPRKMQHHKRNRTRPAAIETSGRSQGGHSSGEGNDGRSGHEEGRGQDARNDVKKMALPREELGAALGPSRPTLKCQQRTA